MKARIDPDEYDLSQLGETLNSPGYQLLKARLSETYANELKKLATADNWDNTRYVQGVLAGLAIAGQLPEILKQAIQQRAKAKRRSAND